jgi:hypothetical protein
MPNELPDDLIKAYRDDIYVHNALERYVVDGAPLVDCLIAAVKVMHERSMVLIDQLDRCRRDKKPYWAGDNWTPPEEGQR